MGVILKHIKEIRWRRELDTTGSEIDTSGYMNEH
jgi:hypothetical protein